MKACIVKIHRIYLRPVFRIFRGLTVTVKLGVWAVNEQNAVEVAGVFLAIGDKFLDIFFKCMDIIGRVSLFYLHGKTCRYPNAPYRRRLNSYYRSIFDTCFCYPFFDIIHDPLYLCLRCSPLIPGVNIQNMVPLLLPPPPRILKPDEPTKCIMPGVEPTIFISLASTALEAVVEEASAI